VGEKMIYILAIMVVLVINANIQHKPVTGYSE
jgi:cell division protein FtsL